MSRKPYKGQFSNFENPDKYLGDISKVIYRSSWERSAFRWCDLNENVESWASEELSIFYYNPITNRKQKYYPDLFIQLKTGETLVIEIKPKHQTNPPTPPLNGSSSKRYTQELSTYLVNEAKWMAASEVCRKNGFLFHIWTEDELKSLGISSMKADGTTLLKEKAQMKKRASPRKTITRPKRKS